MRRPAVGACAALALVCGQQGLVRAEDRITRELASYIVSDDAIDGPLAGQRGDPALGQALIAERHRSLCILCHGAPSIAVPLQGTLAPSLAGIGSRLSEAQIRLRIVDMKRLNPDSLMPSYYVVREGVRVAPDWQGKPLLEAAEIEHLVAYLVTLKE
ncbi:sulfur oxidation c-type cytochrome SoxX [Ancylobacter sp. A5.8]|uniref:sulfur oxidation c-type cytochrome SoxX n=1 Tax=Ancylobacter gelatini TaxID=2919920 RepID=UPI001F4DFD07|nr:sulfur oxidation c-type cytochrome SoxX [Ancylobacter gelatini]MCJ8142183.1 sulfur oxidation c-type cytochrome SoxX [Ancylobacter gelatini]